MKLSTKCRYGLRAALQIALHDKKTPAKRKDIAGSEGLSSSYLENILLVLRNNKIIKTSRGVNGGYVLCKKPSQVSVFEIVDALEGPLSVVDCVDTPKSCEKACSCATRTVWCELTQAMRGVLEKITLQNLLDREKKGGDGDYSI